MTIRERTDATRDDECFRSGEHADAAPLSGTRAVRPKAAPSMIPSVASQLTELHAELDHLDHFELLGVDEKADRQTIRRAFAQRAHRFHPDRLGANGQHLRALAAKVFLRMAEAYQVLDHEGTRKHYVSRLGLQRGRRGGSRR